MSGSDLEKTISIFDLSDIARSGKNFVAFFDQTGLTVQEKRISIEPMPGSYSRQCPSMPLRQL